MARLESSVSFGNTKKFNHSLAKRIPNLYNNLSRNEIGALPYNSTSKLYSLYRINRYRHTFFTRFRLGYPELKVFVFDVRK